MDKGCWSGSITFLTLALVVAALVVPCALAAEEAAAPPPTPSADVTHPISPVDSEVQPITAMTLISWGGWILWITMAGGFAALVMALYFTLTLTPKREVPPTFVRRLMAQLHSGDYRGAYQMCEGRDELFANVMRAGLKMHGHDRYVIQEAMESEGERCAAAMWQRISWLNNIGMIAPLMGLLGTVWGMVLAFSNIASTSAQVRSLAVAENVSKALVTTVGGLVVAIPSLCVYYFLKGRVTKIVAAVEAQATEVIEVLTKGRES